MKFENDKNYKFQLGNIFKLSLTCIASICTQSVFADHDDGFLDFEQTRILLGCEIGGVSSQGNQSGLLDDEELSTGIKISEDTPEKQWIIIDWSGYEEDHTVNGVYIHTDENQMTSGRMRFYVDDVECPAGNVGVNGIGGVFNCGLSGRKFVIACSEPCSPYLAVNEIKLWKSSILSTEGTPYNFEGNEYDSNNKSDINKIFFDGSYTAGNGMWRDVYMVGQGEAHKPGLCIDLGSTSQDNISGVIALTEGGHNHMGFSVRNDRIDMDETGKVYGTQIYFSSAPMPKWNHKQGTWTGQHVCAWRNSGTIHMSKIIVLGTDVCSGDDTSIAPLDKVWSSQPKFLPQKMGDFSEMVGPTYTQCGEELPLSDVIIEFFDVHPTLTSGLLDWVTLDKETNTIRVQPSQEAFTVYLETEMQVGIKAYTVTVPHQINFKSYFSVEFEKSPQDMECEQSQITSPLTFPEGLEIEMYSENLIEFQIQKVTDTGSTNLATIPGHAGIDCGPFDVIATKGSSLLIQQSSNSNKFTISAEFASSPGPQDVEIEVFSTSYGNIWTKIKGQIMVLPCQVLEVVDPDQKVVSALHLVFELPFVKTIELPLFVPEPLCALTNADIYYALDDSAPNWVTLNTKDRKVEIDVDDPKLLGTNVPLHITASFRELSQKISFAVTFMKPDKVQEVAQQQSDEPEPEPEPEEEKDDATVSEPEPQEPAQGWDGWKSLLNLSELLPEGVNFPAPNPDPSYVPTPPRPTIAKVSPRGATEINFNEDVFVYENLKNLTVPKSPPKRDLQTSVTIDDAEQVSFIEVYVEPGELSDPSKLGFDYTMDFVNNKTIKIDIFWENPPYVSANQPEDVLVIKFNGPFFDQQDGVEIETDFKVIRQVLPPQLVVGGITDAIEGAGGSLQITSAGSVAGNLLLAGSLNQVWGMVNNLQIVVHSPLVNVQFPANAFLLYDVMITIATFDVLPTDDVFPSIFPELPEDNPFNNKFDRLQIGSSFLVMNMGTMLLIFTFYAVLYAIYPCVKFIKDEAKWAKRLEKKIRKMIFWNHTIIFLYEGFLDILISCSVNLYFLNEGIFTWDTPSLFITNLLSIFLIVSLGLLFIFVVFYLWPRFDQLKTKKIKRKFEPAYEMLNLHHGQGTMLWPILFMVRRILFVVGVCALTIRTEIQLILFMMPTMACMMVLAHYKPLQNMQSNKLETYNSFVILTMIYCLMCFTQLALDAQARYTMGYVLVALTAQNIMVNIYIVSQDPVRRSYLRCKVRYHRRNQIKKQWKLKAQKTKNFFKRSYTSLTGKEATQQLSIDDESKNRLETIHEEDSDDSQLGRFNRKVKASARLEQEDIDELNAQAVSILESRAAKKMEHKTKVEVQEVFDRYAFGKVNSTKTKYQLPYIEDLVDTRANKKSKSYDVYNKQKAYQNKTLHALRQKADALTVESSSQRPTSSILLKGRDIEDFKIVEQKPQRHVFKTIQLKKSDDGHDNDSSDFEDLKQIEGKQAKTQRHRDNISLTSGNIMLNKPVQELGKTVLNTVSAKLQTKNTSITGALTQTELDDQKIEIRRQILQNWNRAGQTEREESKTIAKEEYINLYNEHPTSIKQTKTKHGKSKVLRLLDKGVDSSQTSSLNDNNLSESNSPKNDQIDFQISNQTEIQQRRQALSRTAGLIQAIRRMSDKN